MRIRKFNQLLLLISFSSLQVLTAQDSTTDTFPPYWDPIMRIYSNFHSGFQGDKSASEIEITRAYLGFEYFLSENFSAILKLDIGSSKDATPISTLKRYAYFKSASINYKKDKLSVNFGLIDTKHFKTQEQHWGHRYILKSFMDQNKYAPSADLGATAEYNFTNFLAVDLSFMNGEGYQSAQLDNAFETGIGISLLPTKKWTIRAFIDYYEKEEIENTFGAFVGYKSEKLIIGSEFNYQRNFNFNKDNNSWGVSGYASYNITERFQLFGRYDFISTNVLPAELYSWNWDHDGSEIIAGVQFNPVDKLKIAIDYQSWLPYYTSLDTEHFLYLNFEFDL